MAYHGQFSIEVKMIPSQPQRQYGAEPEAKTTHFFGLFFSLSLSLFVRARALMNPHFYSPLFVPQSLLH